MSYLSWVSFILGVWLMISPWTLGFTANSAAFGNNMLVGGLIAVLGLLTVRHDLRES
ncbi:MAG: SPW repeat protein [Candidatus Rokuibacteriota bacterium]